MQNQKGYTALIIMLAAAAVFLTAGFFIIKRHSSSDQASTDQTQHTEEDIQTPNEETSEPEENTPVVIPADWKTYTNTKYGYAVKYPANVKAGSVSGNSALGTFQIPVRGFDVGPLVFVSLTGDLRKDGADYFNSTYNVAVNPPPTVEGAPVEECKIDKINNPNASVKSVTCNGEGGPARYALITGTDYDIFVDGYSKGFDESDNGEFKSADDYITVLSSFKFSTSTSSQTSTDTQTADASAQSESDTKSTLAVQSFTVTADDNGATPATITVPKGTIVNLTFNVSAENVYYGGLDFRSSVANTGKIVPGGSKTIAFTVKDSFAFIPYWPADDAPKPYKISIVAE